MANYNNNFTDELRARLSIVDVVGRRVPLTKKGGQWWGCCPFHNEKTPSFSVREDWGKYHCFGCGESGDIISFTMKTNNMDFKAAIAELANQAGLKLPDYKPKSAEQEAREQSYLEIYDNAAKIFQQKLFEDVGAGALKYIRGRGFSDEIIKKYRIGYAPRNNVLAAKFANQKESNLIASGLTRRGDYGLYDFFRDKLMFPITNSRGQIIAFSGRSMDGSEPKYINTVDTELFHKKMTIFGLSFARDAIYTANRSIVVEGQIDAIQMQTHGFPETVAPLGTALTADHVQILCKHNRNITFCFDGDGAGQKAAARAMEICAAFLRDTSDIRFAFVENGTDPDEILKKSDGKKIMDSVIDNAVSYVDFLWKCGNSKYNIKTDIGQTSAHKYMLSILEKITDNDRKNTILQFIKDKEWNEWRRNYKNLQAESMQIPTVDQFTKNKLAQIAKLYPDLVAKYAPLLDNIGPDENAKNNISESDAEKFIRALQYQQQIKSLATLKAKELSDLTSESVARAQEIDAEIVELTEKLKQIQEL